MINLLYSMAIWPDDEEDPYPPSKIRGNTLTAAQTLASCQVPHGGRVMLYPESNLRLLPPGARLFWATYTPKVISLTFTDGALIEVEARTYEGAANTLAVEALDWTTRWAPASVLKRQRVDLPDPAKDWETPEKFDEWLQLG